MRDRMDAMLSRIATLVLNMNEKRASFDSRLMAAFRR